MALSPPSSTRTAAEEGPASTTSSHPFSGDYLRWLGSQIRGETDRTYDGLLELMNGTEFSWLVANDDNRIGDGLDLRVDFCRQYGIPMGRVGEFLSQPDADPPCSFLEVLIALSRRLEFNAGGIADQWAWQLMSNLQLHKLSDPLGARKTQKAQDIMQSCIKRTYSPDGQGGFFPLTWPDEDQTQVEIWYQMAEYIYEQENPRR